MKLGGAGVALDLPTGWEGEIYPGEALDPLDWLRSG